MTLNYDVDTDVAIDPDDIVEEWLKLPSTYHDYQKELAKAEKKAKEAHEHVKVTRSRLRKKAREEGEAKTESEKEDYYRVHEDHTEAKQAWIDAEYERDLVKAACSSFYRKENAMLEAGKVIFRMEFPRSLDVGGGKRFHDKAMGEVSAKQMERLNRNRKPRRSGRRRKD